MDNTKITISSNILEVEKKPLSIISNEIVIFINNEYSYYTVYRRSFLDKNLKAVSIEVPYDINTEELINILNEVHNNKSFLRREWNKDKFIDSITIDWEEEPYSYDIPINSKIGKKIEEITNLGKYLHYTNEKIMSFISF